jgi:ribonuclease T2
MILIGALLVDLPLRGQRRDESRGQPGAFDYYLLALSWSPEHCATAGRNDSEQCGARPFAFIVHGLWPQYDRGWPQFCANPANLPDALISRMLDIMPSRDLIRHEWKRHGTCSGGNPDTYFGTVRKAYNSIRIPGRYVSLTRDLVTTPAEIEREFLQANRNIPPDGIVLSCNSRYLREVQICLDRSLRPRACGADVRDRCNSSQVVLRRVR